MLDNETWKEIPGYETLYWVSDFGRIRNRCVIMKPTANRYAQVGLSKYDHREMHYVHRLVLNAFVGECPTGMAARHFPNRDPLDNRLVNLQWGTPKQNQADRKVHGTMLCGEKHHSAKLSKIDIKKIRKYRGILDAVTVSKLFCVSHPHIYHIWNRKRWRHIP